MLLWLPCLLPWLPCLIPLLLSDTSAKPHENTLRLLQQVQKQQHAAALQQQQKQRNVVRLKQQQNTSPKTGIHEIFRIFCVVQTALYR